MFGEFENQPNGMEYKRLSEETPEALEKVLSQHLNEGWRVSDSIKQKVNIVTEEEMQHTIVIEKYHTRNPQFTSG